MIRNDHGIASQQGSGDGMDSSADDEGDDQTFYSPSSGLVGLQNIANTCYMNAALQALSNTPPLTGYFLECGDIIEANYEMAPPTSSQRKTGLAKSYYRLVKDMWLGHKQKNGYVNSSSKFGKLLQSKETFLLEFFAVSEFHNFLLNMISFSCSQGLLYQMVFCMEFGMFIQCFEDFNSTTLKNF